jgi:hypothetical protein
MTLSNMRQLGVLSKMDNNAFVPRSFGLGHHAE